MTSFKRAFSDADISWMKNLYDGDHTDLQDAAVELERVYAYVLALEALKAKADDALLRYATLRSDTYEDGKAARDYLKLSKELG